MLYFVVILVLLSSSCAFMNYPGVLRAGKKIWKRSVSEQGPTDQATIISPDIEKIQNKLKDVSSLINAAKQEQAVQEAQLQSMEEEYGAEIARVRKEFQRMKERSYEEANAAVNKAKVDALREVLPLADNYQRAKKVFEPLETEEEQQIGKAYDELFQQLNKVIEGFGVTKVTSLGQPFDVNFMEAILTEPSSECAKGTVSTEYQVGYRVGDSCVRPAMVAVSLGPNSE